MSLIALLGFVTVVLLALLLLNGYLWWRLVRSTTRPGRAQGDRAGGDVQRPGEEEAPRECGGPGGHDIAVLLDRQGARGRPPTRRSPPGRTRLDAAS